MALSSGTRLGDYEVVALIGAGGMGEVYHARDRKLGRDVAIKVLPDPFTEREEKLARFEREARLLASLNHPNIATLHGLEHADDVHFLVMELIEGESLADRLQKGALSLDQALGYAIQIAGGLSAAHRHGVVHRDLKPGNVMLTNPALRQTVVQLLESGERRIVIANGGDARYAASGHLVFPADLTLMAVPFDLGRLEVAGSRVPVVEITGGPNSQFAFSDDGTLVYQLRETSDRLLWIDRSGQNEPLPLDDARYSYPTLSPDGQFLAFHIIQGSRTNLWLFDVEREALSKLTFSDDAVAPIWTPDGKRLTFGSGRPLNLFSMVLDGSAPPERLTTSEYVQYATSWSPDGRVLSYNQGGIGDIDIWTLRADGNSFSSELFVQTPAYERKARFSPDGRWVAYESEESGRPEVYVRSYPDGGNKNQISTDGGEAPEWNPKGGELFYRNGDEMMVVDVETGATFRASRPSSLFEIAFGEFTVTPDGNRFVVVAPSSSEATLNVIVNWFAELKQLAPRDD